MRNYGINVKIITNNDNGQLKHLNISGFDVLRLPSLYKGFRMSGCLKEAILSEKPDVIVQLIGMTSFLKLFLYDELDIPVIGILTSPVYSANEIVKVGFKEILFNFNNVVIHLLGSIIPTSLIRRSSNSQNLYKIIVLSSANKQKLLSFGVDEKKVHIIRPGKDIPNTERPNNKFLSHPIDSEKKFQILYLGSPSTLRGIDVLIKAFSNVHLKYTSCKLKVLSRIHNLKLIPIEKELKGLCYANNLEGSVEFVSGLLPRLEVKRVIEDSNIIVLPFKLVISDMPLSIIESMQLNKPVISTRINGITELLSDGRGVLIEPNDVKQLEEAIIRLYKDKNLIMSIKMNTRNFMKNYPTWDEVGEIFSNIVFEATKFQK